MAKNTLSVKGYDPKSIRGIIRSDDRFLVGARLYAVYLVSLGQSSRKLEELYGTSFKQITNWVHRFEREGVDGLVDKKGRGRRSKLTALQMQGLAKVLSRPPARAKLEGKAWNGELVMRWIEREFAIRFGRAQVYNIVKSCGFGFVKGKGFCPVAK